MKSILRRSVVLASVALMASAVVAPVASANHSWGTYHWARTANPIAIKIGNNTSGGWGSYLTSAISDWDASSKLSLSKVKGNSNPATCAMTSGRVEVCNYNYGASGWLGLASISLTTQNHIAAGYSKMNDYYFDQPQYSSAAWHALVMCQEVGHDFGLDHQDENFNNANLNTCMDYTSLPDSNQHPNQHDYDQLDSMYGHLDSFTSSSSTPGGTIAAGINFNDPTQWGTLVASNATGSTFSRTLEDGTVILTSVVWAE